MQEYFVVQSTPVTLQDCLALRDAVKAEFEFAELPGTAETPDILAGTSMPALDCFASDTGPIRVEVNGIDATPALAEFLSRNVPSLHQVSLSFGRNHPVAAASIGRSNIGTGIRGNLDRRNQPYLSIDLNPEHMQAMDRAELLVAFARACGQPVPDISHSGDRVSVRLASRSLIGLAGERPDLDTEDAVLEPTTFYLTGLSDTLHAWQSLQPLLATAETGSPSHASVSLTAGNTGDYQRVRQALPAALSSLDSIWIIRPTRSQLSSVADNLLTHGDANGAVRSAPLLSFPLTAQFCSGAVLTLHRHDDSHWFVTVASFKRANEPALREWLSARNQTMFPMT